jgi:hypothetical protein
MAGKRPDQHNIDPGEAGSTDHKTNPQVGQGHSSLDETVTGDRQRLAQSRTNQRGGQPFLPDVPSPSAEANRAAHREQVDAEEQTDTDHREGE